MEGSLFNCSCLRYPLLSFGEFSSLGVSHTRRHSLGKWVRAGFKAQLRVLNLASEDWVQVLEPVGSTWRHSLPEPLLVYKIRILIPDLSTSQGTWESRVNVCQCFSNCVLQGCGLSQCSHESHSYKGERGWDLPTGTGLRPPHTRLAPLLSAVNTELLREILFETMYLLLKTSLKTTDVCERAIHKHEYFYWGVTDI